MDSLEEMVILFFFIKGAFVFPIFHFKLFLSKIDFPRLKEIMGNEESNVVHVKSEEQFAETIKEAGDKLVVIDFFAVWCPPCIFISSFYKELSNTYTDVVFIKVDVDDYGGISEEFGVQAMPTFIFMKDQKKVGELVGADRTRLEAMVKKFK